MSLPENKRNVDVFYLDHVKPTYKKYLKQLGEWLKDESIELKDKSKRPDAFNLDVISVDLYLRTFMKKKQSELKRFNKKLVEMSIENNDC